MSHLLRYQPFKTLYVAYTVFVVLVVRLPIWFVSALPASRRPRPSWSIKRVLWIQVLKKFYPLLRKTGPIIQYPTHLDVAPGAGGVWVSAVPHLVTGELETWANIAAVSSVRIPGYWLHKTNSKIPIAAPPMPGEKVIYAMHGGGYCEWSAHPTDPTAAIARGLLQHCDGVHRVFSIEYRLSATPPNPPANPFPAALLDALAGYYYLVDTVGFSPGDIVLEGDSAGGNLALALARYLVEHQSTPDLGLPPAPGGLLLLSPWVDLGKSHVVPGAAVIDHLDNEQTGYYSDAFVGPHGPDASELNRYISPASAHPSMRISFAGFPRTFIVAGGAEVLIDQIRTLKNRMVRDLGTGDGVGGEVTYLEAQDGVHDYLTFAWHEPERTEALEAIAEWVSAT